MPAPKLKVLMVEDCDADARLLSEIIQEDGGQELELARAGSFQDARLMLEGGQRFDAMLVDLGLPDSQGTETVLRLQADAPGVPIVVLTGLRSSESEREAVLGGAQDYLLKGEVSGRSLQRSLRHAIQRQRLRLQAAARTDRLRRDNLRLFRLSHFDPLTKVLNRRGFQRSLARECQRARASSLPLHALLVDLDHFKQINERHSHAAGDAVLHAVAGALKSCVGPQGQVARVGGDEFLVLLRRHSPQDALGLSQSIVDAVSRLPSKPWYSALPPVTLSIGLVQVPLPGNDLATLLKRCHAPLARRKAQGRNGVFAEEGFGCKEL